MRTVIYQQIFALTLWEVADTDHLLSNPVAPEIVWLTEQGYTAEQGLPELEPESNYISVPYKFQVPDEVVTYLLTRWPRAYTEVFLD